MGLEGGRLGKLMACGSGTGVCRVSCGVCGRLRDLGDNMSSKSFLSRVANISIIIGNTRRGNTGGLGMECAAGWWGGVPRDVRVRMLR